MVNRPSPHTAEANAPRVWMEKTTIGIRCPRQRHGGRIHHPKIAGQHVMEGEMLVSLGIGHLLRIAL